MYTHSLDFRMNKKNKYVHLQGKGNINGQKWPNRQ